MHVSIREIQLFVASVGVFFVYLYFVKPKSRKLIHRITTVRMGSNQASAQPGHRSPGDGLLNLVLTNTPAYHNAEVIEPLLDRLRRLT